MDYILDIENLTKRYPASDFGLTEVSFRLPYGAIMGLVGENGAGKTTTFGCILNALSRDGGSIRLFGREMTDRDTDLRQQLSVVLDAGNFPDYLDATQLSALLRGIYSSWDNALFLRHLERFEIPQRRSIRALSRGMAMKLSLAAALAHHPRLLLLDEATSGLDPIVRDELLDVFLEFVQDEQHAILLSTHITGDLEKIADYITFLHDGRVVLSEKKDQLLYDYAVARCKSAQLSQLEPQDIVALRRLSTRPTCC